jgi:hypothetical protein
MRAQQEAENRPPSRSRSLVSTTCTEMDKINAREALVKAKIAKSQDNLVRRTNINMVKSKIAGGHENLVRDRSSGEGKDREKS